MVCEPAGHIDCVWGGSFAAHSKQQVEVRADDGSQSTGSRSGTKVDLPYVLAESSEDTSFRILTALTVTFE